MSWFTYATIWGLLISGLSFAAPSSEECRFLFEILGQATDHSDTDLLVYADWKDEHEAEISAELLRLNSEMDDLKRQARHSQPDSDAYRKLERRRDLLVNLDVINREVERLRDENGDEDPDTIEFRALVERAKTLSEDPFAFHMPLPQVQSAKQSPFKDGQHFHRVKIPDEGAEVEVGRFEGSWRLETTTRVKLTQSFEVSDLITQGQWAAIMGANPSLHVGAGVFFVSGKNKKGKDKKFKVNIHKPVESITWWSTLVFANRLSEIEGRQPVYDLSGIRFHDVPDTGAGRERKIQQLAANGELRAREEREPVVHKERNGYRLPLEAESNYVARGGVQNPHFESDYFFGGDASVLRDYAWYVDNVNLFSDRSSQHYDEGSPQRVGALRPNPLGAHDVYGNVAEWTHGWLSRPVNPDPGPLDFLWTRVARGRGIGGSAQMQVSSSRMGFGPSFRNENIGFRLVRPAEPDSSESQ